MQTRQVNDCSVVTTNKTMVTADFEVSQSLLNRNTLLYCPITTKEPNLLTFNATFYDIVTALYSSTGIMNAPTKYTTFYSLMAFTAFNDTNRYHNLAPFLIVPL